MNKIYTITISLFLTALMPAIQSANATDCDVADLTTSSACQIGSVNNDILNPIQVNEDLMFGFDDWLFAEKREDATQETDIDLDFTITGDNKSGDWSILGNVWDIYSNVMIVMKGGNGSDPSEYIGYLVVQDVTSGNYTTPFSNPNNGKMAGISHWSLYVREGQTNVSEPAPLALLGLGLLGFGLYRKRRG